MILFLILSLGFSAEAAPHKKDMEVVTSGQKKCHAGLSQLSKFKSQWSPIVKAAAKNGKSACIEKSNEAEAEVMSIPNECRQYQLGQMPKAFIRGVDRASTGGTLSRKTSSFDALISIRADILQAIRAQCDDTSSEGNELNNKSPKQRQKSTRGSGSKSGVAN